MDDSFASMDPEKRRRGSLALLRVLYPERYGGEPTPAESAPGADERGAAAPDEDEGPPPEPDPDESACLAGHHRCRRIP